MKLLPNILSIVRMIGSVCILFCDVMGVSFWIIYLVCGISDMADGFMARKLNAVTKTGAILDSLADICFVACCVWQLLPVLSLPRWLWLWAGMIATIKLMNQVSALVKYGRCCFPHTLANKITGALLFLVVPMTFMSIIPITIVAIVATYAAIQEGHFIRANY